MLKYKLIHPQLASILATAGHHAAILIADGHYPVSSKKGPNAQVVSLNLTPGVVNCCQVFETLLSAIPVEGVRVMSPEPDGPYAITSDPPIWNEYRKILKASGSSLPLTPVEKWAFYDQVNSPDHVLTIQTAEMERFANILLTVGVRMD